MHTYKTSQLAKIANVHPNTIRLYERIQFISEAKRASNGYRIFTDIHVYQLRIVRAALEVEIVHNGLRKKSVDIIRTSTQSDFDTAIALTYEYQELIQKEFHKAEEAISIVNDILSGKQKTSSLLLKRKEVSDYLNISMDTLRNWELNGLLTIKRKDNGYRVYTEEDIQHLKIIHALRSANYSLSSILRLLNALSRDPKIDIKKIIDTPQDQEDIITVCDKLLTSLTIAKKNSNIILTTLMDMKNFF